MHKNISSKTPKARLNVVFSNSDCGINQFQGTDSVRPDPKHTQRSNKIVNRIGAQNEKLLQLYRDESDMNVKLTDLLQEDANWTLCIPL